MKIRLLSLTLLLCLGVSSLFLHSEDPGGEVPVGEEDSTCGFTCHWDLDGVGDRCVGEFGNGKSCVLELVDGLLRCRGFSNDCVVSALP